MLGEARDVFAAVAQRRIFDGEHAEPVEEVLAETTGFDRGFEVTIGRGDDAHIHFARTRVADTFDFLLLQHAQQLGLHGQRDFADFIEEEGAAIGEFEASRLVAQRAGECAFHVAEKLALKQRFGHGAAVHGNHRAARTRAALVDGAGDEFLAGAALAGDEHRGVGRRDEFDLLLHFAQRGALAHEVAAASRGGRLFAQVAVFLFEPLLEVFDFLEGTRVGDAHRGVVGEDAQPFKIGRVEDEPVENREHAEHLAAKDERLSGKGLDALAVEPFTVGNPRLVAAHAGQEHRLAGLRDSPNFSHTEREAPKRTIGAREVGGGGFRMARAGDEMQAARLVGALLAEAARLAEVAHVDEPDACKSHVPASGDTTRDGAQHFGQGAVLRHGDHDLWQIDAVHAKLLRNLVLLCDCFS